MSIQDKFVVYERLDGGVSLVMPAPQARLKIVRADAAVRYVLLQAPEERQEPTVLVDEETEQQIILRDEETGQPIMETVTVPGIFLQVIVGPEIVALPIGAQGELAPLLLDAPDDTAPLQALPDGTPVPVLDPSALRDETDDELMVRVVAGAVPAGAPHALINRADLPHADLNFQIAWVWSAGAPVMDMTKARAHWVELWRLVRKPLLEALDVDYQRATEENDTARLAEIVAAKNTLRDVTDTDLSTIATVDALKAVWPACLGAKPAWVQGVA